MYLSMTCDPSISFAKISPVAVRKPQLQGAFRFHHQGGRCDTWVHRGAKMMMITQ